MQDPGALHRNIKTGNRYSALFGQQYGAGLGDIPGAAGPINGKGGAMALLQLLTHAEHRSHGAARTGAAHGNEPQLLDDAGNILAVKAAAGHHRKFSAPETIGRRNDATVPEAPDGGPRGAALVGQAARFRDESVAQGRADGADQQITRPGDHPESSSTSD